MGVKQQKLSSGFVSGRKHFRSFTALAIIIVFDLFFVLSHHHHHHQVVTCSASKQQSQRSRYDLQPAEGDTDINQQHVGAVRQRERPPSSSPSPPSIVGRVCEQVDEQDNKNKKEATISSIASNTKRQDKNQRIERRQQSPDLATGRQSETLLASQSESGGSDEQLVVANGAGPAQSEPPTTQARYMIDGSTKVILVDKSNESGVLWGIVNNGSSPVAPREVPAKQDSAAGPGTTNDTDDYKLDEHNNGAGDSAATNYSVFLVSQHKDHFAILIDIESVDFEPIVNCESQELRFSIVGEISKQLLERKNFSISTSSGDGTTLQQQWNNDDNTDWLAANQNDDSNESSRLDEDDESRQAAADMAAQSPLPVSEAMALLLNAPLNKTILDESADTNDFRLIDATIDYLRDEACREFQSQQATTTTATNHSSSTRNGQQQPSSYKPKLGRSRRKHRSRSGRRRRKQTLVGRCDHNDAQFKELFTTMLNNHLEWDDFKFVCGKTRQLIIPMRSLKLSVSSDEFSPKSSFSIRYRFISDPSELPSWDNGKYYCRNRRVIDLSLKCDGYDDCGDASDESVKICGYPNGRTTSSSTNKKDSPRPRTDNSAASRRNRQHPPSSSPLSAVDGLKSPLQQHNSNHHRRPPAHLASPSASPTRRKLIYFSGDLLNCCQSGDWLNALGQNQAAGQALNLQTLIGDSMKLFSEPLFAPTRSSKGRPRRVKRIVGGSETHKGAWPGQVSLQYEILEPLCHFCAGTLIHPQYVLTAGHCITKEGLARGIKVVLGAHDLRQLNGSTIQERYVDDAQVYPGVNAKHLIADWENDMNNDIALLRLNAPVSITQHIAPACLPPFNTPLDVNTTCHAIGWGQTHGSGSSNLLKHLPLRVVASSECSNKLLERDDDSNDDDNDVKLPGPRRSSLKRRRPGRGKSVSSFETSGLDTYSNKTMVCVNNDHGHGICQGDSGGPLYCERVTASGEHCKEIYGVASFIIQYATVGAMCAVENLPGIFSEVSSKTEWISSTIKMFEQTYRLKYARNT
jgi:secreted trypsin-like serine protease